MTYSLDTNVMIDFLRGDDVITKKMNEIVAINKITISPYCEYELYKGFNERKASKQRELFEQISRALFRPLTNESRITRRAADIYSFRKSKGLSGGDIDILIASWTIDAEAILVTANTQDFELIEGLYLENWR